MQNIKAGIAVIFGTRIKNKAESGAPINTNGLRLPKREWHLSDSFPNVGWNITPNILSNVIIIPIKSGTSVNPPATVPTSSPVAVKKSSIDGNLWTIASPQRVISSDLLSRLLRIVVTYGSYIPHATEDAKNPKPISIVLP
jgi:hypothetical protein